MEKNTAPKLTKSVEQLNAPCKVEFILDSRHPQKTFQYGAYVVMVERDPDHKSVVWVSQVDASEFAEDAKPRTARRVVTDSGFESDQVKIKLQTTKNQPGALKVEFRLVPKTKR